MRRISALRSALARDAGRRRRRSGPRRPSARPARVPRAALDLARPARAACSAVVHRRALRADLEPRPPSGHQPTSMSIADPDRRGAAAERRLDQVEVLDAVDHQHRRRVAGRSAASRRARASARAVGGRVGDDEVLEALLGEPQRLGQGEGEHALGSRGRGRGSARRTAAAADRLRRDPDRLARRPARACARRCATARRGRRTRTAPRRRRRSPRSGRGAPRGRLSGPRSELVPVALTAARAYRVPAAELARRD